MNIKNKMNKISFLILCCLFSSNNFAADVSQRTEQVLRPCIDDQTYAVIHVNLEKLNLDACIDKVLEIVNQQAEPETAKNIGDDLKNFQTIAGAQLKELIQVGGKDFFIVFSMYDFPYFFAAIPIPPNSNQIQLYQQIQDIAKKDFDDDDFEFYSTGGLILAGLKPTIARLKTISPFQSELVAKSFQACGDTTVQAVLFPSSDQHRILSETLPKIPFGSGIIDLTILGKDLQWAALGFNTPPYLTLDVTIQSENSEGAEHLLAFIKNFYKLVGESPKVQEIRPQISQLLKIMTPQKKENQLLLQVDSKTAYSIVNDCIAPSFLKIRDMTTQIVCAKISAVLGKLY